MLNVNTLQNADPFIKDLMT